MRYVRLGLLVLILAGCLGTIYMAYRHIEEIEGSHLHAFDVLPDNPMLIYQSDKIVDDWHRVSTTSILWENLRNQGVFKEFDVAALVIDSIVTRDRELEELINARPTTISLHYDNRNVQMVVIVQFEPDDQPDRTMKLIRKNLPKAYATKQKKIGGSQFLEVKTGTTPIYIGFHRNLLLVSPSSELLEQCTKGQANSAESGLATISQSKGAGFDVQGNLYINHDLVHLYMKKALTKSPLSGLNLAGWSLADLSVNPKSLLFNGRMPAQEGILKAVSQLPNHVLHIHEWIPSSVTGVLRLTIPETDNLVYNHPLSTADSAKLFKLMEDNNERFNVDIQYHLYDWMGDESAVVLDKQSNLIHVFNVDPTVTAVNDRLKEYSVNVLGYYGETSDSSRQGDFGLVRSKLPMGYHHVFGPAFSMEEDVWMATNNHVVIVAHSKDVLTSYLRGVTAETMSHNVNQQSYIADNFSTQSAVFIFAKPLMLGLLPSYLSERQVQGIESSDELTSSLDFVGLELVSFRDHITHNMMVSYNQSEKKTSSDLWEVKLDSPMTGDPFVLFNHRTKSKNILVQDSRHKLYLFTNTGKLLWSRSADGPILSELHQIDIYKNDKLQMLFNTENTVYVVDILGRDVKGFPQRLKDPASGPLAVFDYDGQHDYRILIPAGRKLVNYDKEGKLVSGWKQESAKDTIAHPPKHVRIDGKDIIFTYDNGGNLYHLSRRGEAIEFEEPIATKRAKNYAGGPIFFEQSNSIATSKVLYTDTLGHIMISYLGGVSDSIQVIGSSQNIRLGYEDVDQDETNDYLVFNDDQILVYGKDQNLIFPVKAQHISRSFLKKDGDDVYCALYSAQDQTIYIVNHYGEPVTPDPTPSSGGFLVNDINRDGQADIILGTPDGVVHAYSVQ